MIKQIIAAMLCTVAVGCTSIPISADNVSVLPNPSASINKPCIRPAEIRNKEANKGEALDKIQGNYENANACADTVDSWIEFYNKILSNEKEATKK